MPSVCCFRVYSHLAASISDTAARASSVSCYGSACNWFLILGFAAAAAAAGASAAAAASAGKCTRPSCLVLSSY